MMKRNIRKISLVFFVATSVFLLKITLNIAANDKIHDTLNDVLAQYSIQFEKGSPFSVIRDFKVPFRKSYFHAITAQEKEMRIEIEIIKPFLEQDVLPYSATKYTTIKNLYGPRILPYTGQLTTRTDCPDNKKPEEIMAQVMGEPVKVLLANATERYVLGVWEDGMIKQKAAFCLFYDRKNKTHYQIIIFQPYESFKLDRILNILGGLNVK